jgi:hypothetical protein
VYKHKWKKCGVVMSSGCNTLSIFSRGGKKKMLVALGNIFVDYACVLTEKVGRIFLTCADRRLFHVQRATKTSASLQFFGAAGDLLKCCRGRNDFAVEFSFSQNHSTLHYIHIYQKKIEGDDNYA